MTEPANPLEAAFVDAPRDAAARASQEAAWAGTFDADARAHFSQREIAKLHRRRFEESINGYHMALELASNCGMGAQPPAAATGASALSSCTSHLGVLSLDVAARIMEFAHAGHGALLRDEVRAEGGGGARACVWGGGASCLLAALLLTSPALAHA